MIWMDAVRGAAVVAVGVAAFVGFLQVWMVFAAGIILGLCGAFFTPAVGSVIPDITSRAKVVQANSVFSMLQTGANIIGNSAGGVLFQLLGAPLLFLFNGLSYLFSAANLLFARFPRVHHVEATAHFWTDLKKGLSFVWTIRGLRSLILIAAVINFFANMAFMLFLPFYQRNPALGPVKYGIAMSLFTGGMFLGMAFTAVVKIPPALRFFLFQVTGITSLATMIAFPFVGAFPVAAALLALFRLRERGLERAHHVSHAACRSPGHARQGFLPDGDGDAGVDASRIRPCRCACGVHSPGASHGGMFRRGCRSRPALHVPLVLQAVHRVRSGQGHRPEHQLKGRREDCPRQVLRCIISDEKTWRVGRESNESSRQSGGAPPAG